MEKLGEDLERQIWKGGDIVLWVGLTGGVASGKSTVAGILRQRGFAVVDADVIAKAVIQNGTEGYHEVVRAFGPAVVRADGEIDRQELSKIVFADVSRREELERIIHPRVRSMADVKRRELENSGHKLAFYDVPLLFEKNMRPLFDRVVVVAANSKTQVQRQMSRDAITDEHANQRMQAQLPMAVKIQGADHVIRNEGTLKDLEQEVDRVLAELPRPN